MNDGLLDCFRHNAWATRQLLEHIATLTPEELAAESPGNYGSIYSTLWHLVRADGNYCVRLTGEQTAWARSEDARPSLEELERYVDDLEGRWLRFLAEPFDAERTFVIPWHDGRKLVVPAGVILAQAIHHANEHRAQICTTLTVLGHQPPAIGVWDFAEATNRAQLHE